MTKSQNTKNEQQKDLCITSEQLTEKWKKGELPNGWYWVKGIRAEGIYAYTAEYLNNMYRPRNGEIIIEQVPSYEEWQASEKYNKHLEEVIKTYERKDKQATETSIAYNELLEENTKLKELLEECRHIIGIEKDFATCHFEEYTLVELLTKIDEVLK